MNAHIYPTDDPHKEGDPLHRRVKINDTVSFAMPLSEWRKKDNTPVVLHENWNDAIVGALIDELEELKKHITPQQKTQVLRLLEG